MRVHSAIEAVAVWLPATHARLTGVQLDGGDLLALLRLARDKA
jgi:hypothetical protein